MAAEDVGNTNSKEKKQNHRGPAVTDSRFEAAQWDPRFQRFPKAKRHVEIDKRFEGERNTTRDSVEAYWLYKIYAIPT